ncbi:hypothetical protein ACFQ36_03150 [Arthrobacter sp. GCM10027362]|uniref:hypothetical protein n=1 Tax=Arthrobacter sp. GCM10027362 TaxID=3273379 RepID=UPI00362AD9FB
MATRSPGYSMILRGQAPAFSATSEIAAAPATAGCAHEDEPNASGIVPGIFDPHLCQAVARAVRHIAETTART